MTRWEVAVVGGGPAGAVTALLLARAGRRVVLRTPPGRGGGRGVVASAPGVSETLPSQGVAWLRRVGLWRPEDGHRPCPGTVVVWGGEAEEERTYVREPGGPAWHVDRARLDAALLEAARSEGVVVGEGGGGPRAPGKGEIENRWGRAAFAARPWRADEFGPGGPGEPGPGAHDFGTAARGGPAADNIARAARADVVVDATGRRASVLRAAGAGRSAVDRLTATYAHFAGPGAADDARTIVEAVPDGWWYCAPAPCGRRIAAFFTDADLAPRGAHTPPGFAALTAQAPPRIRDRVGGLTVVGAPVRRSARSEFAHPVASGGAVIGVGDAAHAFDPLSSHGVLSALQSAERAARAIDRHLGGDAGALEEYVAGTTSAFASYLRARAFMYALEWRWRDAPFWARRRAAT